MRTLVIAPPDTPSYMSSRKAALRFLDALGGVGPTVHFSESSAGFENYDLVVCCDWRKLSQYRQWPEPLRLLLCCCNYSGWYASDEGFARLVHRSDVCVEVERNGEMVVGGSMPARKMTVFAALDEAITPDDPIEHLWLMYSIGIGGVERAVLDWLSVLPLSVRQKTGVLTRRVPDSMSHALPLPEGVRYLGASSPKEYIRRSRKLKTVWVQPLVGYQELFADCQHRGIRAHSLVVSTMPHLLYDAKQLAGKATYIVTDPAIAEVCKQRKIEPTIPIPHFIPGKPPVANGKVNPVRLGYVGRESQEKNCAGLPMVMRHLPDAELHYFVPATKATGNPDAPTMHERILAEVERCGVADRTRWHFDLTDRNEIYSMMDVMLLPSKYEGYCLSAHEAILHGRAVVASAGLPITQEGNPGVVTFELGGGQAQDLDEAGALRLAEAVRKCAGIDRAAIQRHAQRHSEESFRRRHLPTFLAALNGDPIPEPVSEPEPEPEAPALSTAGVGTLAKKLAAKTLSTLIPVGPATPKEWLQESINSALAQSLPKGWAHEVWVGFDGGEPIDVPAGVGVVRSHNNHGAYITENLLASLASGSHLSFVDSDDRVDAERAKALLAICPEGGTAGGGFVESTGTEWERPADGVWMWTREAFAALGGFDVERYGSDTDALLRADRLGIEKAVDSRPLYWYRQHANQETKKPGLELRGPAREKRFAEIKASTATTLPCFIPPAYDVVVWPKPIKAKGK
jgi:glycosyltransferase involved in cell wall biosynthesis